MQDNPFPAAERILADIEAVFKKDPKLAEFDIVPVNENQNKSPVLHASHSLGLESWCVRHVFCYIYQKLMDLRKKRRREDPDTLIRLLRGALLLDPDISSFWHMRKELILSLHLDPFTDLHFSAIVLSYKPKCSEAFSHRRWLISQYLGVGLQSMSLVGRVHSPETVLEGELRVSGLAASRYANNYYAWNHRIWVVQKVCPRSSLWSVLLKEWCSTSQWVASHVSDHSGMQYRQFLLDQMIACVSKDKEDSGLSADDSSVCSNKQALITGMMEALSCFRESCGDGPIVAEEDIGSRGCVCENLLRFTIHELLFNTDLICEFVGHEALWCHRRFVVSTLVKLVEAWVRVSYGGELADGILKAVQNQEQQLVAHCTLNGHSDIHQTRFAKRHTLWLARVLNISVDVEAN